MNAPYIRLPTDTSAPPLPYLSFALLLLVLLLLLEADEGVSEFFALLRLVSLMMTGLFPPVENCPDKRPFEGPVGGGMDVVIAR